MKLRETLMAETALQRLLAMAVKIKSYAKKIVFAVIAGALAFSLTSCAADEQMGLCSELGLCPSECDGDDCEETPATPTPPSRPPTIDHSPGHHDNNEIQPY